MGAARMRKNGIYGKGELYREPIGGRKSLKVRRFGMRLAIAGWNPASRLSEESVFLPARSAMVRLFGSTRFD
jgi:hypothetical protein